MALNTILKYLKFRNIQCTLLYYYLYCWFGMIVSTFGPCLLTLSRQLNADLEHVTLALTVRSISYLCGAIMLFFVGNKVDRHKLLLVLTVASIVAIFCIPSTTHLTTLCVCMVPIGLMLGIMDVSVNSMIFNLHREEAVHPYIQILHFSCGMGSVVFPLIVSAVLEIYNGWCGPVFYMLGAIAMPSVFILFIYPTPSDANFTFYEEGIYYGISEERARSINDNLTIKKCAPRIPFFARPPSELLAAFCGMGYLFMQLIAEFTSGSFLSSYAVKTVALHYDDVDASLIASGYWATYAISRISAAYFSAKYSSLDILRTNSLMALFFLILGSLGGGKFSSMLWISMLGYGYATGPFFPTMVSYVSEYVEVTFEVSSMFIMGAACGEIVAEIGSISIFDKNTESFWYFLFFAAFGCIAFVELTRSYCVPLASVLDPNHRNHHHEEISKEGIEFSESIIQLTSFSTPPPIDISNDNSEESSVEDTPKAISDDSTKRIVEEARSIVEMSSIDIKAEIEKKV